MLAQRQTGLSTLLLRPLTLVYAALVRLRNRYYDGSGRAIEAPLPVLSIGNLTVGGTGKTPLVAWVAGRLRAEGRRPAVVSRGYGGRAGRGPLIVSRGEGPLLAAGECGDEPHLLARALPGTIVIVGSDRPRGVEAAARLGADVAVLDDGFQHRRLARDLDIVLIDGSDPFGNRSLLPAGPLREPLSGLARADVVVVTRCAPEATVPDVHRAVRRYNPRAAIVRAGHRAVGFFDSASRAVPTPPRVVAFCGIGNPERFRLDLESAGCEVLHFAMFRDHHRFSDRELLELRQRAASRKAVLVTTEKDIVRVSRSVFDEEDAPLFALRIAAVVYDPEPLLEAVAEALAGRRNSRAAEARGTS